LTAPPPTRRAYALDEVRSALQKSIRKSDVDAACYWCVELVRSGESWRCWRALRTIAVEDCSPEATGLVADIDVLFKQWLNETKGGRSDGLMLAVSATLRLALAPKSRISCWATLAHVRDDVPRRPIPPEALDMHTKRGREMRRARGHFLREASKLEPWEGDLSELEREYAQRWATPNAKTEPTNPWGPEPEKPEDRQRSLLDEPQ
jgi:replication-associated recombination protein RarA